MYYIDETNRKEHVYTSYPRNFLSYRWFKPLFVMALFMLFYLVLSILLITATGYAVKSTPGYLKSFLQSFSSGYDDFNIYDWPGTIVNLGSVAAMIPALWLARMVVRDRPLSSYSSARGGWSSSIFFKCLGITIIVCTIPILIDSLIVEREGSLDIKFTVLSFILCTILGPIQCIAEEYVFRGLLMQTIGSWVRVPLLAVILQAGLFAMAHPYNTLGKAAIFISGLTFGLCAWIGRGIEVSSALHVANNMTTFYLLGLNLTTISSEVTMPSFIFSAAISVVYLIIVIILRRTTTMFDKVKKDDVTVYNEKVRAGLMRKAEKLTRKAERAAARAGMNVDPDTANKVSESSPAEARASEDIAAPLHESETATMSENETAPEYDPYERPTGRSSNPAGKHFRP